MSNIELKGGAAPPPKTNNKKSSNNVNTNYSANAFNFIPILINTSIKILPLGLYVTH